MRGNCYVASEALFHILGGKTAGWSVYRMRAQGDVHYWLEHDNGMILDPSRMQFKNLPDYSKGKKTGFMTKRPSRRAVDLIGKLTWQAR